MRPQSRITKVAQSVQRAAEQILRRVKSPTGKFMKRVAPGLSHMSGGAFSTGKARSMLDYALTHREGIPTVPVAASIGMGLQPAGWSPELLDQMSKIKPLSRGGIISRGGFIGDNGTFTALPTRLGPAEVPVSTRVATGVSNVNRDLELQTLNRISELNARGRMLRDMPYPREWDYTHPVLERLADQYDARVSKLMGMSNRFGDKAEAARKAYWETHDVDRIEALADRHNRYDSLSRRAFDLRMRQRSPYGMAKEKLRAKSPEYVAAEKAYADARRHREALDNAAFRDWGEARRLEKKDIPTRLRASVKEMPVPDNVALVQIPAYIDSGNRYSEAMREFMRLPPHLRTPDSLERLIYPANYRKLLRKARASAPGGKSLAADRESMHRPMSGAFYPKVSRSNANSNFNPAENTIMVGTGSTPDVAVPVTSSFYGGHEVPRLSVGESFGHELQHAEQYARKSPYAVAPEKATLGDVFRNLTAPYSERPLEAQQAAMAARRHLAILGDSIRNGVRDPSTGKIIRPAFRSYYGGSWHQDIPAETRELLSSFAVPTPDVRIARNQLRALSRDPVALSMLPPEARRAVAAMSEGYASTDKAGLTALLNMFKNAESH